VEILAKLDPHLLKTKNDILISISSRSCRWHN